MSETYDSKLYTIEHIYNVQRLLGVVCARLNLRAINHDKSKLSPPEKEWFDEYTPRLAASTYGSDEYKQYLEQMKPILEHHYANNRHHPEHHANGVRDMNLIDLLEMLCDWKAATMRHNDGDIIESIKINGQRFGYGAEMEQILLNSLRILEDECV